MLCCLTEEEEKNMIRKNQLRMLVMTVAFLLPLSFAFAASDGVKGREKLTGDDERFVKEAASGGMMEVQLGKLAAQSIQRARQRVR
jgi:predicted outer membrane protein